MTDSLISQTPKTIRSLQLRIVDPCPSAEKTFSRAGKHFYCDGCSKTVHDLSKMSRWEIYRMLAEKRIDGVCGRIRYDQSGQMIYRKVTSRYLLQVGLQRVVALGLLGYSLLGSKDAAAGTVDKKGPEILRDRTLQMIADTAYDRDKPAIMGGHIDLIRQADNRVDFLKQGPSISPRTQSEIPSAEETLRHSSIAIYNEGRIEEPADVLLAYFRGSFGALVMMATFLVSVLCASLKRYWIALAFLLIFGGIFMSRALVCNLYNSAM